MLNSIFETLNSKEPISKVLRKTAYKNKNLIILNIFSSIAHSITEGSTLGIIYLAISVILGKDNKTFTSGITSLPIIKEIFSYFNDLTPETYFILLISIAIILQFIQFIAKYINKVSTAYFSSKCRVVITSLIHSKVLSISFQKASKFKIGDLSDYAVQSQINIRKFIEITFDIIVNIILIITYLLIMISISLNLLIAVLIIVSIIFFVQKKLVPLIQKGSVLVTNEEVNLLSSITEDFQGLRFLHSHGLLNKSIQNLNIKLKSLEKRLNKQALKLSFIDPFSTFLPIPAVALIAILNVFFNNNNDNFLAGLVTFILSLQRLNAKITTITSHQNSFSENYQRIIRINKLLSINSELNKNRTLINVQKFSKNILFEKVFLSYSANKDYALKNINLGINKGGTLAIVGQSGAGKSSIIDLIIGLNQPNSGNIYIDNKNLKDINLQSWQTLLGVVNQDTFLFNTTIFENISYGLKGCNFSEVEEAAELASAKKFIENLPNKYNTVIGDRGYTLSGGERQRIALARAFIRKPQIIILDEATSALDSKSESIIKNTIKLKRKKITFIIIAHRLSTIQNADTILVLDDGEIESQGSHKHLILNSHIYKTLWDMQSKKNTN